MHQIGIRRRVLSKRFLAAWVTVLGLALPAGPARGQEVEKEVVLVDIPEPSVANLEETVRDRLEVSRADLERLLARQEIPVVDVAEAFSYLGKLYLAYDLRASAKACFENALTLVPLQFEWPYYLAVIAQKDGEFVEAEDLLERTLVLSGHDTPTLLRMGQVRLQMGDLQGAEWAYRQAISIDPTLAAAYYGIGQVQRSQGRFDAALASFSRALTYQPDAAGVHYQLGLTLRQLGRDDEARRHLAENRRLEAYGQRPVRFPDPLMIQANALAGGPRIRLGRCSGDLEAGRIESALIECTQALRADPGNTNARHLLAMAQAENGDLATAELELRKVVEQDPDSAFAFYNLGSILIDQDKLEEALEMFRQATRLESEFPEAQFAIATTLWRLDRTEETLEQLDSFLEDSGYHLQARLLRAAALTRLERWDDATAEYLIILQRDPADPQIRLDLAALLVDSGRLEEAGRILQPALTMEMSPELRLRALSTLAGIHHRLGDFEAAIEEYRELLSIDPEAKDGYFNLGSALLSAGDGGAAAEAFARSRKLEPSDESSLVGEVLGRLEEAEWGQALILLELGRSEFPESKALEDLRARVLAMCPDESRRDPDEAVAIATALYRRQNTPHHAETLGIALAAAGRFAEAVNWQRQLLEQATRAGIDEASLARLAGNLERYEAGFGAAVNWQ